MGLANKPFEAKSAGPDWPAGLFRAALQDLAADRRLGRSRRSNALTDLVARHRHGPNEWFIIGFVGQPGPAGLAATGVEPSPVSREVLEKWYTHPTHGDAFKAFYDEVVELVGTEEEALKSQLHPKMFMNRNSLEGSPGQPVPARPPKIKHFQVRGVLYTIIPAENPNQS